MEKEKRYFFLNKRTRKEEKKSYWGGKKDEEIDLGTELKVWMKRMEKRAHGWKTIHAWFDIQVKR